MVFGRRQKTGLWHRVRGWLWPRRSWTRSARYIFLRMTRMRGSTHNVALSFAIGVFVACTPFLGLQMALAALLAFAIGGSASAAVLGTFVGNPVTWPAIWLASHSVGSFLISSMSAFDQTAFVNDATRLVEAIARVEHASISHAWMMLLPVLEPMIIGSLPIGLLGAVAFYVGARRAIRHQRGLRRLRLARLPRRAIIATMQNDGVLSPGH